MKILNIEDCDNKAAQVERLLREAGLGVQFDLHRCRNVLEAIRELEATSFDVVILDLVLPLRNGEMPDADGGRRILSEIMDTDTCLTPSHLVCLTEFEEAAERIRSDAASRLVHVVKYSDLSDGWREALLAKLRFIKSRLDQSSALQPEYSYDIAIVTSSPHVELREVTKLPGGFVGEFNRHDAIHYYFGNWPTQRGRSLRVVACAAPTMGMTAACATVMKVVQRWRPRFLAMCGIAAGTKRELAYGDILVAQSAFDYGSGKIVELENGMRNFIPSPSPLNVDTDVAAILQRWERDQLGMDEIRRGFGREIREVPRLAVGVMASGAAVVQSPALVDEILRNSRKVVGLEMEAYGVFHGCQLASKPRPVVLVAKSVSDFANPAKADDFQDLAAYTSSRFLYEFFTREKDLDAYWDRVREL